MKTPIRILALFFLIMFLQTVKAQTSKKIISFGANPGNLLPTEVHVDFKWVSIAAGYEHTLAINEDGELFSWGLNYEGQLGVGDYDNRTTPTQIGTSNDWVAITAGNKHSIAINSSGELFAWGWNEYGQLGNNSNSTSFNTPQKIGNATNWAFVAAGDDHSLAINTDGELFAWGENRDGELGLDDTYDRDEPEQVGSATNWSFVAAGDSRSFAINTNGELFAWGDNDDGELGLGDDDDYEKPEQVGSATNWTLVSSGGSHSMAINTDGELFAWGRNSSGQLGLGDYNFREEPEQIDTSTNWVSVSCGRTFTIARKSNQKIFSWGRNDYAQLGLGHYSTINTPQIIGSTTNIQQISAGEYSSFALNSEGDILGWGDDSDGKLGMTRNPPTQASTEANWVTISVSAYHNLAINSAGQLYAWGYNGYGELGIGNTDTKSVPQLVGSATNWVAVAAGTYHSLAINSDGELYAWGYNIFGQLGIGTTQNQYEPKKIGTNNNWVAIAVGKWHSLALNTNGEMFAWGYNGYGQLGTGNTTTQKQPFQIGTSYVWEKIACGFNHSLTVNLDGDLYSWGYNNKGQLGIGSYTNKTTLQLVSSGTDWINVSAGLEHTLAINSNHELFAWGNNLSGQLGNGTNTLSTNPIQIGSSSNWTEVMAGSNHSLALNNINQLYGWGANDYGQLGNDDFNDLRNPQMITYSENWSTISAGTTHTFALTNVLFKWNGTDNFTNNLKWSENIVPTSNDSAEIIVGTMAVNTSTTLDVMKVNNGSTVKLEAPLTLRNLHLNNGTIDLNGHRLTITGGIYQSTDSANYYIQAGTSASPKPLSELVFATTFNTKSTLYFNPNANTLKAFELGTATKTVQVTLGNAVKIKGGKTPSNVGSLKVNNGSKLIIPSGASLTLACDTFNSYLNLSHPAQRAIHCSGTGTFNIERQHYGARGWRLYSHPFTSDIDLSEIADDIDLIGSGGTAEGFSSDTYQNTSAYWYDYSKADTSLDTDPAWTGFSSANGTLLSGNPNKWRKHSPVIVFNPGAVKGTGAFSNPAAATYQEGKITLSYVLDSNAVHLNDGSTQTISTAVLSTSPKSRFFLLTNPFTAPIRLGRIQGLNTTNCDNHFWVWKQNHGALANNFMPGIWEAEPLFNGNDTRDSNICLPAFGTLFLEIKDPSTPINFVIPESAKQLSNFDYVIGGDVPDSLSAGPKQQLFLKIPKPKQGPNSIEIQLLHKDSVAIDRVLVYDRPFESPGYTFNDAKKFKEASFANIYSLARTGEALGLDVQDITARLQTGVPSVEIPLVIERDFNKTQGHFRLRIWEKHSELQTFIKDAKTGQEYSAESFNDLPIAFEADETVLNRYSLVFKRNSSSTEDFPQEKEALASQAKMDIIVYPNPGADYIHIRVTNNAQYLPYALYASDGRVVKTGNIKNFETLDIKSLSKGIFYLNCNGISAKVIKP